MKIKSKFLAVTLWFIAAGIGCSLVGLSGTYLYLSPQLPSVDTLRDVRLQTPLRIYSADGKLIGEFGDQRRTPVKFDDIPPLYIQALLAAEDAQFFTHHGVSIKGISRAVVELVTTGKKGSGGSTLTMQVARNYFLTKRKAFIRKFNEILLALRIEKELTKEEIFELYVNVTFLGKRAYGIEAAAQVYYGRTLNDLTLPELAMIAGLPQGPSFQNPIINPERAKERRNWILGRMLELGSINEETYAQAVATPVTAKYHGVNLDVYSPYVSEMARKKAIELFGYAAYTDGYRIYTTVDSRLQDTAQQAVVEGLITYDQRHGYRGPEQNLPLDQLDIKTDESGLSTTDYSPWLETLKATPSYGNLKPAIVTGVEDQRIHVLTEENEILTLEWDQGLSSARPYISEDSRGPSPKLAEEIVAPGDLIRIKQQDGMWRLSQIPEAQAALISLSPQNGAIRALVGGFDFHQSNFNRVTQARRQPGSNFKPFVYTAALEHGMTAASIINDAPIVFEDGQLESTWRPENDGGRFYGPTRLREALYRSRNLVSIRILRNTGISNVIDGMSRFGFDESELPRDLSLALGSHDLTPLQVATGYAVFANGGYKVEPYLVEKILNFDGRAVFEALPPTVCNGCDDGEYLAQLSSQNDSGAEEDSSNNPYQIQGDPFQFDFEIKSLLGILEPSDYPKAPKVLDDQVAYIMDSILKDVVQKGTGYRAKALGRTDLAGKTGTTNGPKDAWFSGYNGNLVATTWVGFDQHSPLGKNEYGGSAALPIWIDFMKEALKGKPNTHRAQPPGMVTVRINPETGERARIDDPDAIFETFRAEHVPQFKSQNDATNQAMPYEESITEDLF